MLYRVGFFPKLAGLILWFMAIAFASGEVSARAQSRINLEARAGLDGLCKTGSWIPVRVMVENTGADVEARVQVSFRNMQGGDSIYAADLSLPATSRKEVFLYVHAYSVSSDFQVAVLEGSVERAKQDLRISCGRDADLYFAVLSDTPSTYDVLNDLRPLNGNRARLAQLTLVDIPDRAQGLSALDALVISDVDSGKLTAAQKEALKLWVANGGRLLVTGGVNWQRTTAALGDMLPLEISFTRKVSGLPALATYIRDESLLNGEVTLASGRILEGGDVLVAQDDMPLLTRKNLGSGVVYYLAADPALQPLRQWNGMRDVYEHLLAFRPYSPAWTAAVWETTAANNALAALPELDLPAFFYICCWLGCYIAAIGPVNYLILRRFKRRELAWVTIPVLAIVFSCLAYGVGFAYRGFTPVLNRLALAQGWDDVPQARVNHLVGVYSPSRESYTLQSHARFMLYPPENMGGGLQGGNDWLQIKTDAGASLPNVLVEIGGMAAVGAEGYMPLPGFEHDLALTLSSNSPALSGTITNASGYALREVVLVTPSEWLPLGNLEAGESKKISAVIFNAPNQLDVYSLFSTLGLPYYAYQSEEKDIERRASFLRANLSSLGNSIVSAGDFYLMAWADDIPAPVDLFDQKTKAVDTTLYFQRIHPQLQPPRRSMVLTSSLYAWESSSQGLAANFSSDPYEIRFQLAAPIRFTKVTRLNFDVFVNASNLPIGARMYLWNFERRKWDEIPAPWKEDIPNPQQYLGADSELRVKLEGDTNNYIQVEALNFRLEVTP